MGNGGITHDDFQKWKNDPRCDYQAVQNEVWSSAEPLFAFEDRTPPAKPVAAVPRTETRQRAPAETLLPEGIVSLIVVRGEVAVLTSRGELSMGNPRGDLRPLAADARAVVAGPGTLHVLFAKSPLSGKPAIARYDLEGHRFAGELRVEARSLLWARKDCAIVERDDDLILVDREGERRLVAASGATVLDTGRGAVVFAPAEGDGETRVVRLEVVGRRVDLRRSVIEARLVSVCASGERVTAVDDTGSLVQLRSEGPRFLRVSQLLGGVERGEKARRVFTARKGLLVQTDKRFLLQTGSAPLEIQVDSRATFVRDVVTGELYGLAARELRRWDDEKAAWVDVRVGAP